MSDQVKNFAYSTTTAAVTAVATSFSVQSGHGSRFPATSGGAYNLVVWNPIHGTAAIAANNSAAEIVRVTTRSTDTFSVITRAQEGTSAIAWGADWRVEMNVTAKNFEDASATVSGLVTTSDQTFSGNKTFDDGITVGKASDTDGVIRYYDSNSANVLQLYMVTGGITGTRQQEFQDATGTIALTSQLKHIFTGNAIAVSSGATVYASLGGSATSSSETGYQMVAPCAGTLTTLYARRNSASGGSCTVTVRLNGADTALSLSIATQNTNYSDTDSIAVAAGDLLSVSAVGVSANQSGVTYSVIFLPS